MNVIGKFALGREVGLHKIRASCQKGRVIILFLLLVLLLLLFGWAICGISPVFESPNIIVITIWLNTKSCSQPSNYFKHCIKHIPLPFIYVLGKHEGKEPGER